MTDKYERFKAALIALCDEHKVTMGGDYTMPFYVTDRETLESPFAATAFWQGEAPIDLTDPADNAELSGERSESA